MSPLFDLGGKTALITGASSGMGRAIAEALGLHGATVILSSNDQEGCEATAEYFRKQGIIAHTVYCDVSSKEDIDELVKQGIALEGKIDILMSCVGIAPAASFLEIDAGQFERTLQINLQSAIYLSKKVLPQMVERREGVIVYLASIAAVRGNKHIGLYGISKAGLVQLARNLAVEYGPHNIRVNTISPGLIDTPFSESLLAQQAFLQKRLQLTPLRRVGQPDEIAGTAVLLASKAGAFITGQNIIIDGGTTISDGN